MSYHNIREEELKNKVAQHYFEVFDCSKIIGNVDFCVSGARKSLFEHEESLLWAEAKKGIADINFSLVQLILTVGKARTFDTFLPPPYLGAFDAEKIAFIPYNEISDVFYQNDFNWKVTPSDHNTKEFKQVLERVKSILEQKALIFNYDKDTAHLKQFIKENFVVGKIGISKIKIDKNNFMVIYNKWLTAVKPSIAVNWDIAKKNGIIDGDFYLADLLAIENETLKEKLFVLLKTDHYESHRRIDEMGMFNSNRTNFKDKQKAHTQFWNKYERPPKEEYWDYIVERRDLLVPQDVRERKGSYFTPQIWVELSQKYLTDVLGEDWQDEYYIWDCAAGTGNLLTGLTNKYHIWASTLDKQDVEVMKDRIKNGANLLEDHVFQFDFLNDDFDKLPEKLREIIDDPEERKKLVIYINPPYKRGLGVANTKWHKEEMGEAKDELFTQFLFRIYTQIPSCYIAEFSKLKVLQSPNFSTLRGIFLAKLEKMFVVKSDTFDNVKGQFPIGFKIWNTIQKFFFEEIYSDIYLDNGVYAGQKFIINYDKAKMINIWLKEFTKNNTNEGSIGILNTTGNDFQNHNRVRIVNNIPKNGNLHKHITSENLIRISVYFIVRIIIEPNWLNDRDQFFYPNENWREDAEFQNDCLTLTLLHDQNRITTTGGTNHWIPFTEAEVNAREKFDSNFMTQFIKGKHKKEENLLLPEATAVRTTPLTFSAEAESVFDAGRELWKYYHAQPDGNVNASLYDIREYFQGRNDKGKMNNKSTDEIYNQLIGDLRTRLKVLARKIEPKVYDYGFLKR